MYGLCCSPVHPIAAVTVEACVCRQSIIADRLNRQAVVYIISLNPLTIVQKITSHCVPSDMVFDGYGKSEPFFVVSPFCRQTMGDGVEAICDRVCARHERHLIY